MIILLPRSIRGNTFNFAQQVQRPLQMSCVSIHHFLGTDRYNAEVCEKNLREAIDQASGKADACRRIMMADACGYIHIRQFSDARKAELINPFASPKYTFTDDDFCKARCRNPRA